jgi:hypothetical protein
MKRPASRALRLQRPSTVIESVIPAPWTVFMLTSSGWAWTAQGKEFPLPGETPHKVIVIPVHRLPHASNLESRLSPLLATLT